MRAFIIRMWTVYHIAFNMARVKAIKKPPLFVSVGARELSFELDLLGSHFPGTSGDVDLGCRDDFLAFGVDGFGKDGLCLVALGADDLRGEVLGVVRVWIAFGGIAPLGRPAHGRVDEVFGILVVHELGVFAGDLLRQDFGDVLLGRGSRCAGFVREDAARAVSDAENDCNDTDNHEDRVGHVSSVSLPPASLRLGCLGALGRLGAFGRLGTVAACSLRVLRCWLAQTGSSAATRCLA